MGIELSIKQDFKRFERFLNNTSDQLPYATFLALKETGFDMRETFNKSTLNVFNRPTKFTQNAFLTTRPSKTNLIVHIFANDKEGRNRARYLRYGVKGGNRPVKGYESYFSNLPNDGTIGRYFLPVNIPRNTYGNVTQARLKKVSANVLSNKAFIGTPMNSSRRPGIYERDGSSLITRFVTVNTRPSYTGRFNLQAIGDKVVLRRFNQHFSAGMSTALK